MRGMYLYSFQAETIKVNPFWADTNCPTDRKKEMYRLCWTRNLREVQAYLWNRRYSSMRALSARSSSLRLSQQRTTMTVENHWKQIKHQYLHKLNRPRLDLTVPILCTEATLNLVQHARALAEALP